ncbi:hypothetical protein Vi05172_g7278 [Venturia inaequalis]|uniref:Uncharacterized protein n=1 Tax=Venturia inaequalis TaxID=5025 RepID=A0A8H3Z3E3_VENIN|nr:hypothetical protein EG327_005316 [Venturia inaequalis]RDI82925.1 hypothetical protein Vi05172_g7278 [Venturia inaequalis]
MPAVRTVPPYVRSSDWEEETDPSPSMSHRPPRAISRVGMTLPLVRQISQSRRASRIVEQGAIPHNQSPGSRWAEFMVATGAPRPPVLTPEQRQRAASVWEEYDRKSEDSPKPLIKPPPVSRSFWFKRVLLKNAFVPLFFRLIQLITSIIATGLSADVFHSSNCTNGATTYMTLIVGVLAILFTSYQARDEFTSKPIGLRKASAKLTLIMTDLFFIMFMSANVSLAWAALWSDCSKQTGIVAVLMFGLMAWLIGFIISLYRLVFVVVSARI